MALSSMEAARLHRQVAAKLSVNRVGAHVRRDDFARQTVSAAR